MKRQKIFEMALCGLFAALIAVGAFIKIPVPVVPFTLQVLFVLLAGMLLGGKNSAISVCVYVAVGLLGLPVFTQGGGIFYVFKPTFGYIIGFAFGAFAIGKIAHKNPTPSYKRLFAAGFVGIAIIYFVGVIYFYLIRKFYLGDSIGVWPLLMSCLLMPLPGDIVSCVFAVLLSKKLIPIMKKFEQ